MYNQLNENFLSLVLKQKKQCVFTEALLCTRVTVRLRKVTNVSVFVFKKKSGNLDREMDVLINRHTSKILS